ncbi:unnamed protein product [Arctogadus glacialis]
MFSCFKLFLVLCFYVFYDVEHMIKCHLSLKYNVIWEELKSVFCQTAPTCFNPLPPLPPQPVLELSCPLPQKTIPVSSRPPPPPNLFQNMLAPPPSNLFQNILAPLPLNLFQNVLPPQNSSRKF